METTRQSGSPLLQLPSEIRKEIYRYLTVHEGTIHVATTHLWAAYTVKFIPGLPVLTFACRSMYDEVKSIYYQENTFTFTRNALQFEVLRALASQHGKWIDQITSVDISQYIYRRRSVPCELDFNIEVVNDKLAYTDLSKDIARKPGLPHSRRSDTMQACLCEVASLARMWQYSLIAFVEACAEFDLIWKRWYPWQNLCETCCGEAFTRARRDRSRKPIFMPPQEVAGYEVLGMSSCKDDVTDHPSAA